jgi:hypothetical protein
MKVLKYSFVALLSFLLIGFAGYLIASTGIKSQPGYANLTLPGFFSTKTALSINVGPMGMKPVQWIVRRIVNASDETLELPERVMLGVLQDVQGVQLRVYEIDNDRHVFKQAIDESIVSLRQDDWQTVLVVNEDDQRIVMMQSEAGGVISGISVLASTPDNAVFINLVGQLDPVNIARYADSLN